MGLIQYLRKHQMPSAYNLHQHDVPAARLLIAHQLMLAVEQSSNMVNTFASAASRRRLAATTKIIAAASKSRAVDVLVLNEENWIAERTGQLKAE